MEEGKGGRGRVEATGGKVRGGRGGRGKGMARGAGAYGTDLSERVIFYHAKKNSRLTN